MPFLRVHRRALAVVLALVWAAVPMGPLLHADAHGHRYCAEHQTFEEGGAPVVGTLPDGAAGARISVATWEGADAHLECPLVCAASRGGAVVPPDTGAGIAAGPAPHVHRPSDAALASIDPLSLAPKLSPPVS